MIAGSNGVKDKQMLERKQIPFGNDNKDVAQAMALSTRAWASVWICLRWGSPLKLSA